MIGSISQIHSEVLLPALRDTSKPIVALFAARSPRSRGHQANYRRNRGHVPMFTTMAFNVNTRGRFANMAAGVRIGPRYPDAAQAHLVDFGTQDRFAFARDRAGRKIAQRHGFRFTYQRDLRQFRGRVIGSHWMLHAWEGVEAQTIQSLETNVQERIEKILARAGVKP